MLSGIVALGAYQINHVWAVTMKTAEAAQKLAALNELQVKGRRCQVIDPKELQVKLRIHWLLHGVDHEDVKTALASFGKVTEVTRERWLFGHNDADCVRSYAVAARSAQSEPSSSEHMMDVTEAEEAAKAAGNSNVTAETSGRPRRPKEGGTMHLPPRSQQLHSRA
ncbi:uncharacterized protein [Dermacentor albipictus]|uniref:uncharacterized protein n=1 Tax=Dermacentor albipictus TaxID=60249 RepID=UPI0038FC9A56